MLHSFEVVELRIQDVIELRIQPTLSEGTISLLIKLFIQKKYKKWVDGVVVLLIG
jgi:hypothetical protein